MFRFFTKKEKVSKDKTMQRSRSGSRLIETAFVSRLPSSLEDLDEVDRLANHPVLRPSPTSQLGRLRKSRSEMGGSVGRGLSVWGQNENRTKAVSKSGQNSPVTPCHFGCRTVGVAMMIKSGKRYKASQSSADLHYARSPSGLNSPLTVTSDSSTTPIPPRRPKAVRHHVVTAVIETIGRRACVTPPADLRSHFKTDGPLANTPPNTAPLPTKFGRDRASETLTLATPPQNLLARQLNRTSEKTDNSLNVTSLSRRFFDSDQETSQLSTSQLRRFCDSDHEASPPKYRLPLSVIGRLQIEKDRGIGGAGSGSCSSSADSTPQKRPGIPPKPHLPIPPSSSTFQQPTSVIKLSIPPGVGNNIPESGICRFSEVPPPAKRPTRLSQHPPSLKKPMSSRFFGFESESCSSAVSSLDSVCSGSSDGIGSSHSNSDLSSANSSSIIPNRTQIPPKMLLAKFQVLSPISDKSQEQSSEQGDSAKTPKISPTDQILACCGANLTNTEDENAGDDTNTTYTKLNMLNFNNNNYNQCNSSSHNANNNNNNNLSESEPSPAPFSMPKLQRRLREQQQLDRRREYNNSGGAAHGSDSGISMASQDVLDIYELLQLPFDMPKLRRKTQQIVGPSRPQSVPNRNQSFLELNPLGGAKEKSQDVLDGEHQQPSSNDNLNCASYGGLNSSNRFSLNLNSLNKTSIQSSYQSAALTGATQKRDFTVPMFRQKKGEDDQIVVAPPPPGFVDDTDQYYMPEDQAEDDRNSDQEEQVLRQPPIVQRRNRPQMTLMFGVDTSEKTLMFATNSPFGLNDCVEINPNLPLERQDWYHGAISRKEAESILKPEKEGSYVVRNVDSARQEFALSLKSARGYMHMRIRRDPINRDFQLSDFERRFLTISEMVHHYTRNRLPIKGAEHMCLKQPVAIRLL